VQILDISVSDAPDQVLPTLEYLKTLQNLKKLRFVLATSVKNREAYTNLRMFEGLN
jgi:hypothetical protein